MSFIDLPPPETTPSPTVATLPPDPTPHPIFPDVALSQRIVDVAKSVLTAVTLPARSTRNMIGTVPSRGRAYAWLDIDKHAEATFEVKPFIPFREVKMASDTHNVLISISHNVVVPEYLMYQNAPRIDVMERPSWWAEAHRLKDRGMDPLEICRWMPSLSYDQVSSAFGTVAVADVPPPDAMLSPEHWLKVMDYRERGYNEDKILRYLPSLTRNQALLALATLAKKKS